MQLTLNYTETQEYFSLKSSNESLQARNDILQAKVGELQYIIDNQTKTEMDTMVPEESDSETLSVVEPTPKHRAKYLGKSAKADLIPILNELCSKGCHTQHKLDLFCVKHGYTVQAMTKFIASGKYFYLLPGSEIPVSDRWTPTTKLDPDALYIRACIF